MFACFFDFGRRVPGYSQPRSSVAMVMPDLTFMPIMGTPGQLWCGELDADHMAVQDVVRTVLDAFRKDEEEEEWQFSNTQVETAGSIYMGCRVLMSFSVRVEDKLDDLGQLQPGAFERPTRLEQYLIGEDNYRTLALLCEWKAVTVPEELVWTESDGERSHMSVVQKLLVRQNGCNWEECRLTLELRAGANGKQRWMVRSLYKDYHDPAGGSSSMLLADDAGPGDPEETRNC